MRKTFILTVLVVVCGMSVKAQDCNPCVAIDKLQIISPRNLSDTLAQLNAGTRVGMHIQIDNSKILGVNPDYTRLLTFSDDKKANLLRKGEQIGNFFDEFIYQQSQKGVNIEMLAAGFDFSSVSVSPDGHSLSIDVSTLAKPTNGAQTLYLEGQVGLYIDADLTEEVPVRNVNLNKESPTTITVRDTRITFTFLRSKTEGPITTHIFQYSSDKPILAVSESASRTPAEQVAVQQVAVSGFENVQLMIEVPKVEIREVPFTILFGLGL